MGEIEVGEYIRTKNGNIGKVLDITNCTGQTRKKYLIKWNISKAYYITSATITTHSKNIIDLIEVGDYVNGREVRAVYDIGFGKCYCFKNDYGRYYDKTYKIKSIVTKEQFESIKYEVNYENK